MNLSESEQEALYYQAIDQWGADSQLDMLQEEAAEMIVAVNKYRRSGDNENLLEEIADVDIMISQMKALFGEKDIEKLKQLKLLRLQRRLEKHRINSNYGKTT